MSGLLNGSNPGSIVTYTGKIINPLTPDPDSIDIVDIWHSLSNQCRFTGHVKEFYSVAQHSVMASWLVPEEDALAALLHDASEAYLADIARPVKHGLGFGETYREVEANLQAVILTKYGLNPVLPKSVHWADDMLLRSEQRDLMPDLLRIPGDDYLDFTIEPWTPGRAEDTFADRWRELT